MADTVNFELGRPNDEPDCQPPLEPIAAPRISDEEFRQAAKLHGASLLNPEETKAFKSIGLYLDQLGAIHYQNGKAIITRDKIAVLLNKVSEMFDTLDGDPDRQLHVAEVAAILIEKELSSQRNAVQLIEVAVKTQSLASKRPRHRSFIPGVAVQVNVGKDKL